MNNKTYKLKLFSPVHVGSGEKLGSLDFIIDSDYIKVYSFDKLISHLTEESLNDLISEIENNLWQGLDYIKNRYITPNLEAVMLYAVPLKGSFPKEIHKHIKTYKDGSLLPYIPGSEIKGSIRTAIIYKYLKDNFDIEEIQEKIVAKNGRLILRKIKDVLNEDFLKNFYLSDTTPVEISSMEILEVKVFATSNSKNRPSEFAEFLKEETELSFSIKIDNERLNILDSKMSFYIQSWKECCYEFYKDLIDIEKNYWKNVNKGNVLSFLENLEKEHSMESPVIRIGRFTGKLSHTILPLIAKFNLYEKNRYLFPKTRRIANDKLIGWVKIEN